MRPAKAIRPLQRFFTLIFILVSVSFALASNPDVIKASHNDVSPPLSQMAIGGSSNSGGSDSQTPPARSTGAIITNPKSDPVAAPLSRPLNRGTAFLHFDGQNAPAQR